MTLAELQDEVAAVEAIFPGCPHTVAPGVVVFSLPTAFDFTDEASSGDFPRELAVTMAFPDAYPEEAPLVVKVENLRPEVYVDESYYENVFGGMVQRAWEPGMVCMYEVLVEVEEFLRTQNEEREKEDEREEAERQRQREQRQQQRQQQMAVAAPGKLLPAVDFSQWCISAPVVDRKSVFIAYARRVESLPEAHRWLNTLLSDGKIARATHNMTAWRIRGADGVVVQDCDDDGEKAAGGRMLHLLTLMDVWNVMVVVLRWYGGVHLGSDRFRHINAAARDAVSQV